MKKRSMSFYSDARASTIMPVVCWIAIAIAVLLSVLWYANNFEMTKITLEQVENDLSNIRTMIDDACLLTYYTAEYNPVTETGSLKINRSQICIESNDVGRCKALVCDLEEYETEIVIDLGEITFISVTKEEGVMVIDAK